MEKYKGYTLNPEFCDPKKDWGEHKGHFFITFTQHAIFNETYAGCINDAKKYIDNLYQFDLSSPEKIKEEMIGLFTTTGYDSIDYDERQIDHFIRTLLRIK